MKDLQEWVEAGGNLIWNGISTSAGFESCISPRRVTEDGTISQRKEGKAVDQERQLRDESPAGVLLGVDCVGKIDASSIVVEFAGQERMPWNLTTKWRVPEHEWPTKPANFPSPPVAAKLKRKRGGSQKLWMSTDSKSIVAVRNVLGKGSVLGVVPPVTASIVVNQHTPARDRWHAWFQFAIACVEDENKCGENQRVASSSSTNNHPTFSTATNDQRALQHNVAPLLSPLPVVVASSHYNVVGRSRTGSGTVIGVYIGADEGSQSPAKTAFEALALLPNVTAKKMTSPLQVSEFKDVATIVVPSQEVVDLQDQLLLSKYVHESAGCLLWHGYYPASFSTRANDMLGAAAVDFRSAAPAEFEAFGMNYTMTGFRSKW